MGDDRAARSRPRWAAACLFQMARRRCRRPAATTRVSESCTTETSGVLRKCFRSAGRSLRRRKFASLACSFAALPMCRRLRRTSIDGFLTSPHAPLKPSASIIATTPVSICTPSEAIGPVYPGAGGRAGAFRATGGLQHGCYSVQCFRGYRQATDHRVPPPEPGIPRPVVASTRTARDNIGFL